MDGVRGLNQERVRCAIRFVPGLCGIGD